ncbi:MAG: DUF1801 domain-containing protein [Ignavibacteria bacterium]|nr:DUF1801 domain-containing protein [Ignavibacteria bacterium]
MAKAQQKTVPTKVSVESFLNTIEDETKRDDCFKISDIMQKVTKQKPVMWGPAIVGFDQYDYKRANGDEATACIIAFSPRKGNITLYIGKEFPGNKELLAKLGKHKMSGGCLHINKLADVDTKVLKEILAASYKHYKVKVKSQ